MTFNQPANPESESAQAWAQRVWASWGPSERGEFVGAVEIIMDANRGGGTGTPARKRRRERRKDEFRAAHSPFFKYVPDPYHNGSRRNQGDII